MIPVLFAGILCCAGLLLVLRNPLAGMPLPAPEEPEVERLRSILMNHTGQPLGELRRWRGRWHAFTARGWMRVEDLLRCYPHGGV